VNVLLILRVVRAMVLLDAELKHRLNAAATGAMQIAE